MDKEKPPDPVDTGDPVDTSAQPTTDDKPEVPEAPENPEQLTVAKEQKHSLSQEKQTEPSVILSQEKEAAKELTSGNTIVHDLTPHDPTVPESTILGTSTIEVTPTALDNAIPCDDTTQGVKATPLTSATSVHQGMQGPCSNAVDISQAAIMTFYYKHETRIIRISLLLLLLAYLAYFVCAMVYKFGDEGSIRLLVFTVLGLLLPMLHFFWDRIVGALSAVQSRFATPQQFQAYLQKLTWVLYAVSLLVMVILVIVLVALSNPSYLNSLMGLAGFIILSWITSINPGKVNWHPVFWGFSLQFYFACIILKTQWGYKAFTWLGDRVSSFIGMAAAGANFAFGPNTYDHMFIFALMPVIVLFSAVISVLYYLGVMQVVVSVVGRFLAFCLGTTPAESINTAANIFVGLLEAPLMVQPFVGNMTKSELHAVMTGGFATISGSVLGIYISFGIPANHLLSASVMSAPAALAISKLTYPETEVTKNTSDEFKKMEKGTERNVIEAASVGASNSISLVANIVANLIAFLSILNFVNAILAWLGDRVGFANLSFQLICSYVLYPVALFMGTEPGMDCRRIGELVGLKIFTNEFIAYQDLQKMMMNRETYANYSKQYDVNNPAFVSYNDMDVNLIQWNMTLTNGFMSRRSEVVATYALCGFSHIGSMGVMIGALTAMVPHRSHDIAELVFRAMIAGNTACFFTACIAGLFFEENV